jgi:hypothetical protein
MGKQCEMLEHHGNLVRRTARKAAGEHDAISVSSTRMLPWVGRISPLSMRTSVDFGRRKDLE